MHLFSFSIIVMYLKRAVQIYEVLVMYLKRAVQTYEVIVMGTMYCDQENIPNKIICLKLCFALCPTFVWKTCQSWLINSFNWFNYFNYICLLFFLFEEKNLYIIYIGLMVVSTSVFHCGNWGSNPGRGSEIWYCWALY